VANKIQNSSNYCTLIIVVIIYDCLLFKTYFFGVPRVQFTQQFGIQHVSKLFQAQIEFNNISVLLWNFINGGILRFNFFFFYLLFGPQ